MNMVVVMIMVMAMKMVMVRGSYGHGYDYVCSYNGEISIKPNLIYNRRQYFSMFIFIPLDKINTVFARI